MPVRDIGWEQRAASTSEELADRLSVLMARYESHYPYRGYKLPELKEYHGIRSELYCREKGIKSVPWVTHSRPLGARNDLEVKLER